MGIPVETYDIPIRTEWKMLGSLQVEEPMATLQDKASRLGVNVNTVRRWLKDNDYQRYENWLINKTFVSVPLEEQRIISETYETHAPDMQQRLLDIIESTNDPKLESALAQDWLDRTPSAPKRGAAASSGGLVLHLDADALATFINRATEAGLPPPIDVTVEKVEDGHSESEGTRKSLSE
jgi:hypothetical protein|tara:strand:+ start:547 stop:1086 length:540 start_codon:yes stop_codon:yes gene_type:complete